MVMNFFFLRRGGGVNKVHYGLFENGEWRACLQAIAPFSPWAFPLTYIAEYNVALYNFKVVSIQIAVIADNLLYLYYYFL